MSGLSDFFLKTLQEAASPSVCWRGFLRKDISCLDHFNGRLVLRNAPVLTMERIGRGVHRPWKLGLQTTSKNDAIDYSKCIFKSLYCQLETKTYCKSVDLNVTSPERELLAYEIDQTFGFDLIPPVVARDVDGLGNGAIMAWVNKPLAIDWIHSGKYDYRQDKGNPWLHLLVAFDFMTGQLDRHACNFIIDENGRVYAIDNGYSFVRDDDRRFLKCNVAKHLLGCDVHPFVARFIKSLDPEKVVPIMKNRGFENGEIEGVQKRINDLKKVRKWIPLGGRWFAEQHRK